MRIDEKSVNRLTEKNEPSEVRNKLQKAHFRAPIL